MKFLAIVAVAGMLAVAMPPARGAVGVEFKACLDDLRVAAVEAGVAPALADEIVPSLRFQARVIELDRAQPEFQQTFAEYLGGRVTAGRVQLGRVLALRHRDLLTRLTREYGVPGQYLVALWGMESSFGRFTGKVPTLDALATLACDPRRSEFFRGEFLTALRLVERESLRPADFRGSWAGAVGQTQFMPSAFEQHAVDGDGDGRIDLWNSTADALASGANHLRELGWRTGERWGREVRLPEGFDYTLTGAGRWQPLSRWAELGVRRAGGAALPTADMEAALLVPMGRHGPAFLVYRNFEVLLRWNRSHHFALAAGHLADRIAGGGALRASMADAEGALSSEELAALQGALARLGYEPGPIDGLLGPATRAALRRFQADNDMIADGYPDAATRGRVLVLAADQQETPDER
jgi:membrane-bound lytic murein transglycosylase B